jgi:PAS domain S-box-containing protein
MHGYESVEEFQKVKVADLYQVPEDRKVFLADLFRQGSLANYEVRLKQRDGTPIYGSVSAAVHRGPDGEMDYIDGVIEDITERKKAEQTLAEALELNRTLISASTVGIAVYHASGRCILANEALARISGGTLDQLREQNFRRLKSWRADGVLAIAEAALKTGQPQQFEGKSRASFGRELAINARFAPFVNRGEQHLLVMVTDETEAQRAQQALRASEERYRALAESSPDAIFILDRDIKIQYVNSAAASWWRRPPEELIGLTQADLFPPETAHHHCQVAAEVLKTGQPLRRDESLALPTGEQWIEIRLVPLHGEQGGVNWVMGVCRDISERKRAEIALQQAERLQRAILDNIPDPAWLKDAKGRFLACNQAIATFYGQPVKALLGKTVLDCKPAEAAHSTSEDQEVMTTRRSVVVEAPSTDAQGRVRWWESIKSPLFNERDEVIGTVGIARDVTERRRLERHILEISDREQARLGQDIHDGLCQQLVSLAFDANSLQSELSGRRLPETKQARRIADCLDQAITEARQLSRGLFPVRLETDGLPSAMAELAKAASARFQIQCRFDSQGRVAVKDVVMATHLYRIAQEALANAVKHSRGSKVSIRLKGGASQLELTVEDDGAGLSAAKRKKATGMGLHIMAYRARAIGGTLHLGPGPRGGMLVSCCIPRGTG